VIPVRLKTLFLIVFPLALICLGEARAQDLPPQILRKADSACVPDSTQDESVDNYISVDKLLHLSVSLWLSGFSYYSNRFWFSKDRPSSRILSFSLTVSVGVLKEIWDRKVSSHFSFKDLMADLLGAAFGLAIFTLNEP